jgi:hypothetical protein
MIRMALLTKKANVQGNGGIDKIKLQRFFLPSYVGSIFPSFVPVQNGR